MQSFFSSDGSFLLQFLVIFLIILVLLMGAVVLFRKIAGRGLSLTTGSGQRGRQPRLGIVDIYELDRHRQLILLRRDNVEHLLLVGGPNDVVIERQIQRGARFSPDDLSRPDPDTAPEPAPRVDPVPPALAATAVAPPFVLPESVVTPPEPSPVRVPGPDPGLFEAEDPPTARPRPSSAASRILRRTPPPLVNAPAAPKPDPAPEPSPPVTPAPVDSAPEPPPPIVLPREPRPVDPAVLSDMARQLQVALQRPSSAVTPPPDRPGADDTVASVPPPAPDVPPGTDPVAAGMSAGQAAPPVAHPAPSARIEPTFAVAAAIPAVAPPEVRPPDVARVTPAEMPPAPSETASEPPTPTPRPDPVPAPAADRGSPARAPEPVNGQQPFSVEEIEAEFARLLGRPLETRN